MNTVVHNMTAVNAQQQFKVNTKKKAKSSEKLSSGFRINRAADDAAGLAISEKMRGQIRGLDKGARNTKEGISVCQVADGALAEINEMLHRITELSVQAANGTNTPEDRQAIQREISQLMQEINRIGDTTEFNHKKIFRSGRVSEAAPSRGTPVEGFKFFRGPDASSADVYFDGIDGKQTITKVEENYWGIEKYDRPSVRFTHESTGVEVGLSWYPVPYNGVPDDLFYNLSYEQSQFIVAYDGNLFSDRNAAVKELMGVTFEFVPNGLTMKTQANIVPEQNCGFAIKNQTENHRPEDYLDAFDFDPDRVFLDCTTYFDPDGGRFKLSGDKKDYVFNLTDDCKDVINEIKDREKGMMTDGESLYLEFCREDDPGVKFKYEVTLTRDMPIGDLLDSLWKRSSLTGGASPMIGFKFHLETRFISANVRREDKPAAPGASSREEDGKWWIQSSGGRMDGMFLEFEDMDTDVLGLTGLDASTEEGAGDAITRTAKALTILTGQRSRIGAQQNRLEHTYQNVTNASENAQSAESRIRDTDMADEMVMFSRDRILEQVGEAMMAQANKSGERVLALLQ